MYTIIDYIKWRGDLDFKKSTFNEVDNLILSNLAYIRFKNILPNSLTNSSITIKEAADNFFNLSFDDQHDSIRDVKDIEFLKELSKTKRFGNLKIYFAKEIYDIEKQIQFFAMTIDLLNNCYYIVYRGTDNFIAGWKEDFDASYKIIPSQLLALEYLNDASYYYKSFFKKIYIGGHSKGGHLAMFASAHTDNYNFNKIIKIYNNDGPGFDFNIVCKNKLDNIIPKLVNFTPKTSIIAQLLNPIGDFTIIDSNEFNILQHSPYSWLINNTYFLKIQNIDDVSKNTKIKVDSWFNRVDYQERKQIADGIYEIIILSGAKNIKDVIPSLMKNRHLVQKKIKSMDKKTGQTISSALVVVVSSLSSSLGQNFINIFKKD